MLKEWKLDGDAEQILYDSTMRFLICAIEGIETIQVKSIGIITKCVFIKKDLPYYSPRDRFIWKVYTKCRYYSFTRLKNADISS